VAAAGPARPATHLPPWLVPAGLAALLVAALVLVVVLASKAAQPDTPPALKEFGAPVGEHPFVAYDVERFAGGALVVSGGVGANKKESAQITPPASVRVEVLELVQPPAYRAGDWITIIGVPNQVKSFAIRAVVLLATPGAPDRDGIARTPAGFAGSEAERDSRERPILGGTVDRTEGSTVTLKTSSGPIAVELGATAPFRRSRPGTMDDIREGDRIAFFLNEGKPDFSAVLVMKGGAK